ncbi:carbohydrate ABC transporter permease [Martelella mediterranea]|uniref:Carbohydrate ABC transporter membrane protein 1 (CUT1 family) n=1 Tax=Martelella mediterranea TaxID=293089 RepID=A0A4V2V4Y7_9HYPH|nr:sugar ABC transporter permease [Martelella mediterranea]TCT44941.1 carbohydrate ABC transporter membrane protein 1 (CUT1 family) [Martelella mediterranea]
MRNRLSTLWDGRGFDLILIGIPLAFLIAISGAAILYNVLMSFQAVDMFSLGQLIRPFVGFENYRRILSDPQTWPIFGNTLIFVVGSIVGQFILGLGLALFFQQRFPGSTYLRGLFLVSWVMPGLVAGAIWNWLLSGDFGVINFFLSQMGIIDAPIFWRSNPDFALWSVVIANIWLGTSFNMILLSVGLAAIPQDLYEAAALDGAGPLRRFFTITLPMMRATIGALLSLGLIFTLQQFDLFASITNGGPNNASNVAQYWAWQLSFQEFDFAGGATVSVMMIVVVIVAAAYYVRSTRGEVRG